MERVRTREKQIKGEHMENLEIIISLAGTIIGLTITLLTFLIKFIRSKKAKRVAEQLIKVENAILPYIREAEKFTNYSGAEKKAFVMTKACKYAIDNRIAFDEKNVSEKVEELVALTKQVNVRNRAETTTAGTSINTWL